MRLSGNCCFFAHEKNRRLLYHEQQWYAQDIQILREIGFSVNVSTQFKDIPWGYDLYFSWWVSGSVLPLTKALLYKKPIIVVSGGSEVIFARDSLSGVPLGYLKSCWYKKFFVRICLRYSTRVLLVSNYMIDHVKRLGATNPVVVYNCINTEIFKPLYFPKVFVATILQLDEYAVMLKRGETFIRSIPIVLQNFPKQKFIVIGRKGNAYMPLKKLVSDLGIEDNIEFIGFVENSMIPEFLNRSKIYIQISEIETFGVAIAEAMSCGVPVIVSKQGAIPEIVGDCGVYVDHNDPKSVAAAIINLLRKSENERKEIGLKARSRIIKNFSYENRKRLIKQIIKDI